MEFSVAIFVIIIFAIIILVKTAKVVPQRTVFIIERLGKYRATLGGGFHLLMPFVDKIAYKHSLKEVVLDVPPQVCITKDNIQVEVDGIL